MDLIRAAESENFRVTCKPVPDSKGAVELRVFGNSENGLRFCASKDALSIVLLPPGPSNLGQIFQSYELALPKAQSAGYLHTAEVDARVRNRTARIQVGTPAATPSGSVAPGTPLSPVPPYAPVAPVGPSVARGGMLSPPITSPTGSPKSAPSGTPLATPTGSRHSGIGSYFKR